MTSDPVAGSPASGGEADFRPPRDAKALAARWSGPILCAVAFVIMAATSWRQWPDVLVDFGRELYVPWQLNEGKVLYRDIACLFGPFSQYLNALWFRLFGVSLTTLIFCNMAILAGMTGLLYRLLATACDRLTATVGCLILLLVFAFSQYTATGNYNFICPYAHEAAHGVALSVAMIYCLSRTPDRPRLMSALAGLCFGLVLLTKAEVAMGAGAALVGWLAAGRIARASGFRVGAGALLLVTAGAVLPSAAFFLYFATKMPASQAWAGIAATWSTLGIHGVADNIFYKTGLGTDDVPGNLRQGVKMFAVIAAAAVTVAVVDLVLRKNRIAQAVAGGVLGAIVIALIGVKPEDPIWEDAGRPLPLIAGLAWAWSAVALFRNRREGAAARGAAVLLLWATFSLVLLAKMVLNARIYHYGFYLAMPATMAFVALALGQAPALLGQGRWRGVTFRIAAMAVLAAVVVAQVGLSLQTYAKKNVVVGAGGDAMKAFPPTGIAAAGALNFIESSMPADATFVVLPEGVMLNYLSRRANPTPYINFMIVEMLAFGEETMLASFKERKPDYFVLVHKDSGEHGLAPFGVEPRFGKAIVDWVNANYQAVKLFGMEPLRKPDEFGIKIMKRRAAVASTDEPGRTGSKAIGGEH